MFRVDDGLLIGSDAGISVEIDAETGALRRITNVATSQVLVDAPQSTPWRLTPQGAPQFMPPHIAARYVHQISAAAFTFAIADDAATATLRWETTDPGLQVTVHARFAGGALELWPQVDVTDGSVPPVRLSYPVIERPRPLSEDGSQDRVAWPSQSGWLVRDPLASRPMTAFYPDGFDGASTQMLAYYTEGRGGFYIACHDPHSTCKQIRFSRAETGFDHEAWDLRRGAPMALDYPVVIAPLVRGDWYEATDRYRDWVLAHAPWCEGGRPIAERQDREGARWLREEVGVALWGAPSSLDWSRWYRFYADAFDAPLHITPGWDWAAELPPTAGTEGWFPARFHPENVKAWQGHRVTPYMNDLFMSPRARDFAERWEPNLILPYQTFSWTTFSEPPARWVDGETSGPVPATTAGVDFFMCPATEAQAELHAWRDSVLVRDYGCDGVSYDISSGNPRVGSRCLRAEHGHTPGRGRQIIEAYDRVNRRSKDEVAQKTGKYLALGVETICENVIGSVDYYIARAGAGPMGSLESWFMGPEEPPGGSRELIPLFQAIYHDVGPVHEDGWVTLGKDQGELFYWIAARIFLQWGGILSLQYANYAPARLPGHERSEVVSWDGSRLVFNELPEHDPAKAAFLNELARARTTFARDYLAYGRMLRPAPIDAGVIALDYEHRIGDLRSSGVWEVPAVTHAVWSSVDGRIGLLFVNLRAADSATVVVDIDPSAHWGRDLDGSLLSIVGAHGRTEVGVVEAGRLRTTLYLAPRAVTLLEVAER